MAEFKEAAADFNTAPGSQGSLNKPTGRQLRDEGMADVIAADVAVHRSAGEHIRKALDALIAEGVEFTAATVRDRLPADLRIHSDNLLPAYMAGARGAKRIRSVRIVNSDRPERRRGLVHVWTAVRSDEQRGAA